MNIKYIIQYIQNLINFVHQIIFFHNFTLSNMFIYKIINIEC